MAAATNRSGSMFGKYKLDDLLGQGGMGEVYKAYDTSKDRTVALKILRQELSHDERFRTRFQRESRAAAMLEEPHVIPIYDWGETDGNLFIDMRLVNMTGFGTHSQRGTPETSCLFAKNVLLAYWDQYGNASRQPRSVSAPGAVGCPSVGRGAACDGDDFVMQCAAYGSDSWITCRGGIDAVVYLY